MIELRLKITKYFQGSNTCEAQLMNGNLISFDPFVGCALELSDEDYQEGKGKYLVGNEYLMTEYTVYKDQVVPSENGLIQL